MDVSIVIPAYNEAERLGPTLERVLTWPGLASRQVEVIVVDDGSLDATARLVEERAAASADGRLRVLRNEGNRGKGYSVRRGVLEATGDHILFSDADLSTPIEELDRLQRALSGGAAEVAIGSRAVDRSMTLKRQPLLRDHLGRCFNLAVQALVLPGIRDTQCGFKLFTRRAAHDVFRRAQLDGFAFDVEALFLARALGYEVAEVPVVWINDENTRVDPLRDGLRMLRDIYRIRRLHQALGPHPGER